jgi:POT family proton-dependent oligopeptide transporter
MAQFQDCAVTHRPWRPSPLAVFTASEFCERFAYSGVQATLIFYLTDRLVAGPGRDRILGMPWLQRLVSTIFHLQQPAQAASELVGLFTALFFVSTVLGGVVADRWLGQHRAIVWGGVLATVGYGLLVVEPLALAGIILLMTGSGMFRANVAAGVSRLYDAAGARRDRGLRLFYMGAFAGMATAPLVCGTLDRNGHWGWAFTVIAVGMTAALGAYLALSRTLPTEFVAPPPRAARPASGPRARKPLAYALFFAMLAIAFTGAQQIYNVYLAWARLHVVLTWQGQRIPTSWLLTMDALLVLVAVALSGQFWRLWARLLPEPKPLQKMSFGCLLLAVSYGCLAAIHDQDGLTQALLLLGFHAINGLACANIGPVALAFLSDCTRPASRSTFVGLLYLQYAVASIIAGDLGRWLDVLPSPVFWTLHVVLFAGAGLILLLVAPWIASSLCDAPPTAAAPPRSATAPESQAVLS